jgi:tetratricopeptide (TPR) repeat protein
MTDALRKRLNQIQRTLRGEARSAALELHLEEAEALGDRPVVNETLATLISSYEFSQDTTRLLVPYAKFLRNYDSEPEHFDAALTHRVHWMFKWVVSRMTAHPEVPLASIEDAIAQMRRRYAEAGHSLHPVHEAEYWLYHHIGDGERAAHAATAMIDAEPDAMSNCKACRCNTLGSLSIDRDDYEQALADWAPILGGELRCAHEPHATLAQSLLPLAALGRVDEARRNHLHGYRISRDQDDMVRIIARHLRFCALTGNEARAVEILEANSRWFRLDLEPSMRRAFLEGVQVVCGALRARGLGDTPLTGPDGRTWTADDLHGHVDAQRRAICERYDRRNGTDAVSRDSQQILAPDQTYPHVPLGLRTLAAAEVPTEPARPVQPTATPEAFEAALVRAREATEAFTKDLDEHWQVVTAMAQTLGITLAPADQANALLGQITQETALDEALALAAAARARFTEAGQPGRALANLAATLSWKLQGDLDSIPAEAARVLAEAPAFAESEPLFALRAKTGAITALLGHCEATGEAPSPELLSQAETLDAELAAAPGGRRISLARAQLALRLAAFATELEPRLHALDKAFDLAVTGEHPEEAFVSAVQYGTALNWAGRSEEAVRVCETGLAQAGTGMSPFPIAVLHLTIAESASNLGRPEKVEAHALQAAHYYDRSDEPGCAGVARHLLAIALADQDRHQEAVVIFEAALADLPAMHEDEHWRLVDSHVRLAESYYRLRELRPALREALEALQLMDGGLAHRDHTAFARIAHTAGELLERLHEPDDASRTYRRSEQAWRELHALPMAANPARAAMWVDLRQGPDREAVTTSMQALAEELRTHWQNAEFRPEYRAACRHELVKTLLQHANMLAPEQDDRGPGSPAEWRSLNEQAIEVLFEGEFDVSLGTKAVTQFLECLAAQDERPEAWEAAAAEIIQRLDPERDKAVVQSVEEQLDRMRETYMDEYEEDQAEQ